MLERRSLSALGFAFLLAIAHGAHAQSVSQLPATFPPIPPGFALTPLPQEAVPAPAPPQPVTALPADSPQGKAQPPALVKERPDRPLQPLRMAPTPQPPAVGAPAVRAPAVGAPAVGAPISRSPDIARPASPAVAAGQAGATLATTPTPPASVPATPSPPGPAAASSPRIPSVFGYNRVAAGSETHQQIVRLRNVGRRDGIRLEGTLDEASAAFSVRQDDVLVGSRLSLIFTSSPAVAREDSVLALYINNEPIGAVAVPKGRSETKTRAEFSFSPALLGTDNKLQFKLTVNSRQNPDVCRLPKERAYWIQIDPESFVFLSAARLSVPDDLAVLPRPFADNKDSLELTLPFVLPSNPPPEIVQAASVVAGYFGLVARHKGAKFPVTFSGLPAGNAVVFVLGDNYPPGVAPVPGEGPRIAIANNPTQIDSKLLLVVGANPRELQQAAIGLAYNSSAFSGPWAKANGAMPPARQPYDSPNWVPSDRPVRMGDLVERPALSGLSLKDVIQVPFRTAPDLFFKNVLGAPFALRIERASDSWIEQRHSRMYIALNGARVGEIQMEARLKVLSRLKEWLLPGATDSRLSHIFLPSYQLYSSNLLDLTFDLRALPDADCFNLDWSDETGIDPNSQIDFSSAVHFTALPNLALFANSGFPFSKFADLATTAFVLPDIVSPDDAQVVLNLVGYIAYATGIPAMRHVVTTANQVAAVADRDLIVIGANATQPLHQKWQAQAAIRIGNEAFAPVAEMNWLERFLQPRDWRQPAEQGTALAVAKRQMGKSYGYISSYWSPLAPQRLVVGVGGSTASALVDVTNAFRNEAINSLIQGDFFFLSEGNAGFYSSGRRKFVGELPFWQQIQWVTGAYGFGAFIAAVSAVILIAFSIWPLSQMRGKRRLKVS